MGNVGSIEKVMVFGILIIILGILGIAVWTGNDPVETPTVASGTESRGTKPPPSIKPTPKTETPRTEPERKLGAITDPASALGNANPQSSGERAPANNPVASNTLNPAENSRPAMPTGNTLTGAPPTVAPTSTQPQKPAIENVGTSGVGSAGNIPTKRIGDPPAPRKYVIKSGDTLTKISTEQLGSSEYVQDILDVNKGLDPRRLKVGQEILLPTINGAKTAPAVAADPKKPATETTKALEKPTVRTNEPPKTPLAGDRSKPAANPTKTNGARTYTVKKGDTLYSISKAMYGTSSKVQAIVDANKSTLKSANDLSVGMVLNIP